MKVPTFNIKMIDNPMVDTAVQDYPESSTTKRFMRPRYSRTLTNILTKVVHLLRTEFLGEGYIDKDSLQYAEKYVHALLKLEL